MSFALHNFPVQQTSFVGRQNDISAIRERLQFPDCRLLTIVGAGGMGKTRLAQEVARLSANQFENGVYFVPLAGLNEPHELLTMIGRVLGLQFAAEITSVKVQLEEFLAKRHILMVLDNFEHLLDSIDDLSNILGATEKIKLLVTSREALNIQEEWIHHVEGMSIPDKDSNDPLTYSAVRLFVTRAEKVKHDFDINVENEPVRNICQLVAGMPLALEIAATWLRTITLEQILSELQQGIDVLTTNTRNIPPRHRSVRAVFDHSWRLLLEPERDVFMKICVFRGGFTLQTAREVTNATLLTMSSLVAKSLLSLGDDARYTIHELLRQYGLEKLSESGQLESVRNTHTVYFLQLVAKQESKLKSSGQIEAIHIISPDFENIRAAWSWAVQQQNTNLLDSALDGLYFFGLIASRFQDSTRLLQSALNVISSDIDLALYGRLLARTGVHYHEPAPTSKANLLNAREIAGQLDNTYEMAHCDLLLAWMYLHMNEYGEAMVHIKLARPYFEDNQLVYEVAHTYAVGSWVQGRTLDWNRTKADLIQSEKLFKSIGEVYSLGWVSYHRWATDMLLGTFKDSNNYVDQSYSLFESLNNLEGMVLAKTAYIFLHYIGGEFDKALDDMRETLRMVESVYGPIGRSRAYAACGVALHLENDLDRAYEYIRAGLDIYQEFPVNHIFEIGLCIILWRLERKQEAQQLVYKTLKIAYQLDIPGLMNLGLAVSIGMLSQHYTPSKLLEIGSHVMQNWGHRNPRNALKWLSNEPFAAQTLQPRIKELSWLELARIYTRRNKTDIREYVQQVLEDMEDIFEIDVQQGISVQSPLIEDLTEREAEVLGLIIDGLTNAEIAEELVVGVSTVKKHINNLYSKLGVSHRTQAIARARELRLM